MVRHGWLGLIVQDAAGVLRELVADSHLLAAQRRVCLRDPTPAPRRRGVYGLGCAAKKSQIRSVATTSVVGTSLQSPPSWPPGQAWPPPLTV